MIEKIKKENKNEVVNTYPFLGRLLLTKLFSSLRASPWHSRLVSRATLAWFLATPPTRRPIWKRERGPCNLATSTLVPLTCGLWIDNTHLFSLNNKHKRCQPEIVNNSFKYKNLLCLCNLKPRLAVTKLKRICSFFASPLIISGDHLTSWPDGLWSDS